MAFQIPEYGEVYPKGIPGLLKVTEESQAVNYNSSSPVTIGTLKANKAGEQILVIGAIVRITTAFAGTAPTLQLGVAADPDMYGSNTEIVATTAGTKKFFALGTAVNENPSVDLPIIVTIGGTSLTAGVAYFRLIYLDLSA